MLQYYLVKEYSFCKSAPITIVILLSLIHIYQIRAHLASIGHPIVGDYKYGSRSINDTVKKKYGVRSQLLHSWRLVMPETLPEPLEHLRGEAFTAGLPVMFNTVMEGEGLKR